MAAFFCNALPFALFSLGQQTIDSGVAGVLNATTPLWSLLIGIAHRDRARTETHPAWPDSSSASPASLLIFAPWQRPGRRLGVPAILAAAASYAVGFAYMGRNLAGRGIPTISLSAAHWRRPR